MWIQYVKKIERSIKLSCSSSSIKSNNNNLLELIVFCNETLSCADMGIDIDTNAGLLVVHCKHSDSCNSMNINLNINAKIICYGDNACDRLRVTSTSNILITIIVYNHSDEIIFNVIDLNNINMICGNPNDTHYIQYKTGSVLKEKKVLRDAGDKYSDGVLPCYDITVNRKDSITCQSIYEIDRNVTEDLFIDASITECYWFDIDQLLNQKWNCNDTKAMVTHHILLTIKLSVEDKHIDDICI